MGLCRVDVHGHLYSPPHWSSAALTPVFTTALEQCCTTPVFTTALEHQRISPPHPYRHLWTIIQVTDIHNVTHCTAASVHQPANRVHMHAPVKASFSPPTHTEPLVAGGAQCRRAASAYLLLPPRTRSPSIRVYLRIQLLPLGI